MVNQQHPQGTAKERATSDLNHLPSLLGMGMHRLDMYFEGNDTIFDKIWSDGIGLFPFECNANTGLLGRLWIPFTLLAITCQFGDDFTILGIGDLKQLGVKRTW